MSQTVGLRFARRDTWKLEALADRCRSEGLMRESVTLFQRAADAARVGEPLLVTCESHLEAIAMADGFTQYGVSRPAVEALAS